jgi:hypothetical protein
LILIFRKTKKSNLFCDSALNTNEVRSVICSDPCLVTQLSKLKNGALPTMMLVPAVSQFLDKYAVMMPFMHLDVGIVSHYLQVRGLIFRHEQAPL